MKRTVYNYNVIGQIPGQMYSGQVVDQNGNGLYAGWFYLDKDGNQIMNDTVTDANGFFHFTVPDHNHQNIFIQFYATKEYETVVKSFTEVVNDPRVVLKKKSTGLSTEAYIGLAGLGMGVYQLTRKKKSMGAALQMNKNNVVKTTVILAGIGTALYFIFKYKPTPQQKEFLAEAKKRLEYLAKELGIVPSLTKAQFVTMASQIVRAVDKCGTDEDTIYRAFYQLNNEADFWMLVITFDVAKYDGCFEGSLPSWNVHYTLPEALASDLSPNQVMTVNEILQSRNIDVSF